MVPHGDSSRDVGKGQLWKVIGGESIGGIIVRKGRSLSTPQEFQRLSHGAVVQELQCLEGRLHYSRISGTGPDEGWVSIRLATKALLVAVDATHALASPLRPLASKTSISQDSASQPTLPKYNLSTTAPLSPLQFQASMLDTRPEPEKTAAPDPATLAIFRANIDRVCHLHGLRVVPMIADGNCQFRAIAHHLLGDQEKHRFVRQKVAEWLRAHPQKYKGSEMLEGLSVPQYCMRLLHGSQGPNQEPVWGDFLTLQAVADMEARPIQLMSNHATVPMKSIDPYLQRSDKAIVLTYILDMHYDAAVPDENSEHASIETFPFQSNAGALEMLE